MIKKIAEHNGQDICEATLQAGTQSVSIMNYGCVIRDWRIAVGGTERPVVLGFPTFDAYPLHSRSFGILAGRVANRTCRGQFELDGVRHQLTINNGEHHLHGGEVGLGKRVWEMQADTRDNAVLLTLHSPHGEQGYPGAVEFAARFQLDEAGLRCRFDAVPDSVTPINLAQHNYYNLDGHGSIRDHLLWLACSHYTPVDEGLIPTGDIVSVADTRFDFSDARTIASSDPESIGHDHNLVVNPALLQEVSAPGGSAVADTDSAPPVVARLLSSQRDLQLQIRSREPGLQLFTAPQLQVAVPGHDAVTYGPFAGVCLEMQHFPDSLNQPQWPGVLASPEAPYQQDLVLELTPGGFAD